MFTTNRRTVHIQLSQGGSVHLSLRATMGLEEAAVAAAGADAAGAGKAIDARVASIAFWIASDGCCVVFVLAAGAAPFLNTPMVNEMRYR